MKRIRRERLRLLVYLGMGAAGMFVVALLVVLPLFHRAATTPSGGSSAGDDRWTARLLGLLRSPRRESWQFAAIALGEQGDARAIPKLREIMASGDQPARTAAVRAILRIQDPQVLEFLLDALQRETDRTLTIHAVIGLKRFPNHPRVVAWLLERAKTPDDLALLCIETLGRMRAPVSDQLVDLYNEEVRDALGDFARVRHILDALADIGDEPAIRGLRSIAGSGEPLFSKWAAGALLKAAPQSSRP